MAQVHDRTSLGVLGLGLGLGYGVTVVAALVLLRSQDGFLQTTACTVPFAVLALFTCVRVVSRGRARQGEAAYAVAMALSGCAVIALFRPGRGLLFAAGYLTLAALALGVAFLLAAGAGRYFRRHPARAVVLFTLPVFAAWGLIRMSTNAPPQPQCIDTCFGSGLAVILISMLLVEALLLLLVWAGFVVRGIAALGALMLGVGANCLLAAEPAFGNAAGTVGTALCGFGALLAGAPWLTRAPTDTAQTPVGAGRRITHATGPVAALALLVLVPWGVLYLIRAR